MPDDHPPSPTPRPPAVETSRRRYSISTRIRVVVFLSTFLTATLVSGIAIDAIHRHLRGRIETHLPGLLERRGEALTAHLARTRARLAHEFVAAADHGFSARQASKAGRLLAGLLPRHPGVVGLAIVTNGDRVIAHTGLMSAALARAAASARKGDAVPVPPPDGAGEPVLTTRIGAPDTGRDRPAELIVVFAAEPILDLLRLDPDEGPGRISLVDDAGRLPLATGPGPSRPLEAWPAGTDLAAHEYDAPDGTGMLGAMRKVGDTGLHLIVEAPARVVFSPLVSMMIRVLLFDAVIILLFSLLALRITRAIMQPIHALSESAARISRGEVDHEIPVPRTRDEIGLLTRSFNEMMRKLRRSQEEIEHDKLRLTEQNEELQRANEILAQLSITDGLTKLHNHRFFQDHLSREIKRVERTGEPLSILLMDLDDFKRLNDRHGHAAGDEVLMNIAGRLNENVRESDLLARYGGEEFVILAPNTDLHGAIALAEKIRMSIESMPQIVDDSMRPIRVTISCGVAQYEGDRRRFFQSADRALYRAKGEGKNCVVAGVDPD